MQPIIGCGDVGLVNRFGLTDLAAEADEAGSERGGSGYFERVSGQEREHGKSEDGLEGGVGERGEPEGSAGEDDEAAGGGGEGGSDEGTLGAAIKDGDEERGDGVGEQVAAGGSEEMGYSGERAGGEDGQAHGAFGEIRDEGGCGEARGEEQAQHENGEGR